MGAIRFPYGRSARVALLLGAGGFALPRGDPPLADAPVVWHADDRRDIPQPQPRSLSETRGTLEAALFRPLGRLFHPGRNVRRIGTLLGGDVAPPAANPNALDEVPNSTWFTNRIGLFPLTPNEAARGPATFDGPDRSGPWTVISAKTEGATPGFNIRDASGTVWVIKFDPPEYPGMGSAAAVIAGRVLHTAGYNVPADVVVTFRREALALAEGVAFTSAEGVTRSMTEGDLDALLDRAARQPDGSWRTVASRFLSGVPVGPFDWRGRRSDDPNDRVPHQDRRELRGLRVFAAWLCHWDIKQHNTLDMYVTEDGRRFVKHYLIDFGSTLGASATEPLPARCHEYSVDVGRMLGRTLTVGLRRDPWRAITPPHGLDEIGYFRSEEFDPAAYRPFVPNATFANLTDRDGYWAAKIIAQFSDEHLEAIVAEGRYADPEAARYMVRTLAERRDAILLHYFERVPPLDFFTVQAGVLRYRDLGLVREVYDATGVRYRVRVAPVTAARVRAARSPWRVDSRPRVPLDDDPFRSVLGSADVEAYPFVEIELQVDRGRGWSGSVTVFAARRSGRVVEVRR